MNRSDVPAHEGPTNHAVVEVWTYEFPLDDDSKARLVSELAVIPPLMAQARKNLTGNARDLWVTGIRDMRSQMRELDQILAMAGGNVGDVLHAAVREAKTATETFVAFLENASASKTGPSGIGKDNYTWYQQNVHYVPLTWEDEVRLLKRELDRAWSSLKLEEQRNRDLPELVAASNSEEYRVLAEEAVDRIMNFFQDKEILTITPYMKPAIAAHMGSFRPENERNFFTIGSHYDPAPLFTHLSLIHI